MTKVTRAMLRSIGMGETMTFAGLTPTEVWSGKAQAYQLGPLEGCRYRVRSSPRKGTLSVTREPA